MSKKFGLPYKIFLILFLCFCSFKSLVFAEPPIVVTGRILPKHGISGGFFGDDSDWIEIAKHGAYSLILRVNPFPKETPYDNYYQLQWLR